MVCWLMERQTIHLSSSSSYRRTVSVCSDLKEKTCAIFVLPGKGGGFCGGILDTELSSLFLSANEDSVLLSQLTCSSTPPSRVASMGLSEGCSGAWFMVCL